VITDSGSDVIIIKSGHLKLLILPDLENQLILVFTKKLDQRIWNSRNV